MLALIFSICLAAEPKGVALIQKAVKKYNAAAGVTLQVKKTVKLSLMDETRISEGVLYFSKGKLRLELAKPEDSLIVLNTEAIWVESVTDGLDGPSKHVMKITSKDLKKRTKAPLAQLLTDAKTWNEFKVLKSETVDDVAVLRLSPKNPAKFSDMTVVDVKIDVMANEIRSLSYQDEIENEVAYDFSKTDLKTKILKSKFSYKPPKGAEVVVY